LQVIRRKSTGSSDRKRIFKESVYKKEESDKDSLGDDLLSSSDSDDGDYDGNDAPDGLNVKIFENLSHIFKTHSKLDGDSSMSSLVSSLNESDRELEDDFHPELFGLLDNPGVVRFGDIDYPLEVTEYSDDDDIADAAPDWIRVSYDDLTRVKDTEKDSYRKMLSRSVDDISHIHSDNERRKIQRCDCHAFCQILRHDVVKR
jgi:hypothetical protein